LPVRAVRDGDSAPTLSALQTFWQNAAMLARPRIEHDEIAFLGADPDINFSIRADGEAARIHFRGMHSTKILHGAGFWVESDEFRVEISAGVELAIFTGIELP